MTEITIDDYFINNLEQLALGATQGDWPLVEKGNSVKSLAIPGVCSGISPKTGNGPYLHAARPAAILAFIAEYRKDNSAYMQVLFDKRIIQGRLDELAREQRETIQLLQEEVAAYRKVIAGKRAAPDFDKPIDIVAFMTNELGMCGCAEYRQMTDSLKALLTWVNDIDKSQLSYNEMSFTPGIYYILAGALERAELIEHGVSIRVPWLTELGKQLLVGLRKYTADDLNKADGEAYDGVWHGRSG